MSRRIDDSAWQHLLGTMPDGQIARLYKVEQATVSRVRRNLKIPAYQAPDKSACGRRSAKAERSLIERRTRELTTDWRPPITGFGAPWMQGG